MTGAEQSQREPEAFLARPSDDRDVHGGPAAYAKTRGSRP
jgi:hypothetical protein